MLSRAHMLLPLALIGVAASLPAVVVRDLEIKTDDGSFAITTFTIEGDGTEKKLPLSWNGSAINRTGRSWHKVTFCANAFDVSGEPIRPVGEDKCLLRFWMYEWKSGAPANWKGSQKLTVGSGEKREVQIGRFEFEVEELLSDPENVAIFPADCETVWPVAIQAIMDKDFRPTVSDRASFIASFDYTGGQQVRTFGTVNDTVKALTTAKIGFLTTWEGFRIEAASLNLKERADRGCRAELAITFAGFEERQGWYRLESNHRLERTILEAARSQLSDDYEQDLDHAISQLPNSREAEQSEREVDTRGDEEAEWRQVARWQGSGLKNTDDFKVAGSKWRIVWKASSPQTNGLFQVSVFSADGKLVGMAVNQQAAGADASYHRGAGSYYLQVNSLQMDWEIVVEEQIVD